MLLETPGEVVVVDVREDDYHGGHIRGALNVPKYEFGGRVAGLVERHGSGKGTVVFHCMMSQIRGPYCARVFEQQLLASGADEAARPRVCVLAGGFQGFVRFWRDARQERPELEPLVEAYLPAQWERGW